MKKINLFIDMYGATDVYSPHNLIFCPEPELVHRKELLQLCTLHCKNEVEQENEPKYVRSRPPVITNVAGYCKFHIENCSDEIIQELSKKYKLNFLSTPFREFPNTLPETSMWFAKRPPATILENVLLRYRNDLTFDYFNLKSIEVDDKVNLGNFSILFEDKDFHEMKQFMYFVNERRN